MKCILTLSVLLLLTGSSFGQKVVYFNYETNSVQISEGPVVDSLSTIPEIDYEQPDLSITPIALNKRRARYPLPSKVKLTKDSFLRRLNQGVVEDEKGDLILQVKQDLTDVLSGETKEGDTSSFSPDLGRRGQNQSSQKKSKIYEAFLLKRSHPDGGKAESGTKVSKPTVRFTKATLEMSRDSHPSSGGSMPPSPGNGSPTNSEHGTGQSGQTQHQLPAQGYSIPHAHSHGMMGGAWSRAYIGASGMSYGTSIHNQFHSYSHPLAAGNCTGSAVFYQSQPSYFRRSVMVEQQYGKAQPQFSNTRRYRGLFGGVRARRDARAARRARLVQRAGCSG